MVHRHGFPPDTDRDEARNTAVAEYGKLGGEAPDPLVEYVEAEGELIVVVRSEPKPEPVSAPRMDGLVIHHGDIPAELYDQLSSFLRRRVSRRKLG